MSECMTKLQLATSLLGDAADLIAELEAEIEQLMDQSLRTLRPTGRKRP